VDVIVGLGTLAPRRQAGDLDDPDRHGGSRRPGRERARFQPGAAWR
jgi:hypothetical protein